MTTDIIKELHRINGELNTLISHEQDDKVNGCLCDAYDAVCGAIKRLNDKDYEEFQDDTPPLAKGVPMDFND